MATQHSRTKLSSLALILAAAVVAGPVRPQEAPAEDEVFAGETTVVAVEVPVQVLLDGVPLRGLAAADFRVFEGDTERPVSGFEVVELASTAGTAGTGAVAATDGPLSVTAAGRRHFLLLFDLSFTRPGYLPRAIEGARRMVRGGLHPTDLVGVAFFSERRGANQVLQFTPDRRQVEAVLDAFDSFLAGDGPQGGAGADDGAGDPLGLTAGGLDAVRAEIGRAAGYETSDFAQALAATGGVSAGRPGGRWADNILSHSASLMEQTYQEQRGARVSYLADGLAELARGLRAIQGAKHLVLFSEGFSALLLEVDPGPMEVGTGAGGWVLREVNDMITELERSGWVIHGVHLTGVEDPFRAGSSGNYRAGLHYLAEETGGVLVDNTNDIAAGLEDVLERTSVTYVLTFEVAELPADGRFHPLRVELVDGPRGARVVHRQGFHAPPPAGERGPGELQAAAAARILAGEEIYGLPARLAVTALDYHGGVARVPVLVEIAEPDLLSTGGGTGDEIEVYVYAFDGSGAIADHFAQTVAPPAEAPDDGGGAPLQGLKITGALDLPSGRYDLRVLVRSLGSGREAVRVATLQVPDPSAGPRLLPPVFVQGPGERWLVAELGSGDGAHPFMVEGKRIAPAAVPVLAPGEAARLLLPGMGIAGEEVRIATRILDSTGRVTRAGRLEILGRRAPATGQPDLLIARLDPSGLAPGAYALEVALAGDGEPVRVSFRVQD